MAGLLGKLPSVATDSALAEGGHRLISGAGLGLAVADLLLTTLATRQTGADTPVFLGDHCLVHVLLLQSLVLGALLVTLQLLVRHLDEAGGLDHARENLGAQLGVVLVLEILIE